MQSWRASLTRLFFYFPIKTLFFSQKITCEEGSWEKEKEKKKKNKEREREREGKMGVEEGGAMWGEITY